ncbi:hypothetical protein REB14_22135 [Chryseobacterium sp. ES2]|uniref:Uncharacterized protein n=1 Tax=Chryseobacterium metallicongregator TaxID=3073042 RepID=A0ABU1EB27_9FLAO|nr:hypothetical protein [Chryseobacterium sp. ES2]MDR4954892.1 hypothetical protein [Chryseobacterium sp. ES2]
MVNGQKRDKVGNVMLVSTSIKDPERISVKLQFSQEKSNFTL